MIVMMKMKMDIDNYPKELVKTIVFYLLGGGVADKISTSCMPQIFLGVGVKHKTYYILQNFLGKPNSMT